MGERAEGFSLAMRELGHDDGGRRLVLASRSDNQKTVFQRWLMANLDLEGLACGNANIFFTVLEALDELGMALARPLSLAAFDDLECFRHLRHQVVAIRQPIARMGIAALDMLMQRMKGEGPEAPREMIFPAKLMVRETTSTGASGGSGGYR
jgi:DNA-binding LacI/PurR family transcriptional regulator